MKPHLALFFTALIYGLFYVAIKMLVKEMSPWETFCLRLLLATPLMLIIECLFFKTKIERFGHWVHITGLGLLGITLVQLTAVLGLSYTSVFHTGLIVGLAPIFTLLISCWLGHESLTRSKVLGVFVAFVGLILLLNSRNVGDPLPPTYLLGDFIILFNIILWSLFLILSRNLLQIYPAFSMTTYAFTTATLLTIPFMVFTLPHWPGSQLSVTGWQCMAFVVVFASVGTYFLNYYGLSKLPASVVAIYAFLQPVFTAMFGAILLQEKITLPMLLEGLVILSGVSLATGTYKTLGAKPTAQS